MRVSGAYTSDPSQSLLLNRGSLRFLSLHRSLSSALTAVAPTTELVMVMSVAMIVAVVMVMVFRLHALGPSALSGHSTARVTVVAAAVVDVSQLDQVVLDQAVDRMTPADRPAQVGDSVTDGRPWMFRHAALLSSGSGS